MTNIYEPPPVTEAPTAAVAPARPRPAYGLALLVFLLLLGIGLGLAALHAQQRRSLQALHAAVAQSEARDAARLQRETSAETRLKALEAAVADLGQRQDDRGRLQLLLVEQLLLSANERLRLAQDPAAALLALELADARLALLNDPRLLTLRETLARERGQLARMPRVDRSSAALEISALVEAAPGLPLAARVPERFEAAPPPAAPLPPPADAGWLAEAWTQVRTALNAMFSVRRAQGPAPRLLAPEQEAQVQQILLLRLEAVRAALLRGNAAELREAAASAQRWLQQRYHGEDAGVLAAIGKLKALAALPLDAPAPDISGSLTLLRTELGRR